MASDTAELLLRAQDGDDLAVGELVQRYYPRLRRIVRARLGTQLRALVEVDDILQEAFLQATLRLQDFELRSDGAFLDWLATLAINQIRKTAEHWSRERRDVKKVLHLVSHPADAVSERVQELTARVSGPLTRAIRSEQDAMLEETLDELDEAHREVLLLRNFAGLAWAEVAERLGRESEAAARELHRRARAKLAVRLRAKGYAAEVPNV